MSRAAQALFTAIALLALPAAAQAHRLDEYLQATTFSLTRDHIALHLRLTPGVDVAPGVIHEIDRNDDGSLSLSEQHAYVSRIMQALSLSLNGRSGPLLVRAMTFPSPAALQTGTGVIDLELTMQGRFRQGDNHLAYHNRGNGPGTVWLVNCLLPQDPAITVIRQNRTIDQSSYELDVSVSVP
ncbi:hypothetical protein B0W47_08500 [Komagataeibacter nataicola]|uniref:EF-hand domain-containing protein n=1 Tax=Komagataeibacter nataicola TaxID=265960 RepID=A0A9N7H246_9PROT|nr:hypothetical protein [Komagataeibacter nataicola]AQU87510.1 hypothetical protein B0W47_08500 [Komagataeibacter nataicola]PYD65438.1 hypothetical protein CDI09_13565 [Komagataeibacter nataicola]WEQ55252.1 hypothetical protein LV564_14285 [Komagataeibacter nataicola]WNM09867.1 hypothetical protein RI056_08420 [Komagataeibacter nataicola]GBR21606.1 hypothetical protein AA0616_2072 [Komagataeibacter nataicola NRIC 0616]